MVSRRRLLAIASTLITAGALALALPAMHPWLTRLADWVLIVEDPVARADAIVLTVDAVPEAGVDALRLLQAGIASRVAVFGEALDSADDQKRAEGWIPDRGINQRLRELEQIGLDHVTVINPSVRGTREEARALAQWCRNNNLQRLIVLTVPNHSRRVRRVLRRTLKGPTEVIIRPVHRSAANPSTARPAAHTDMTRTVRELAKLGLDVAMHPLE